MLHSLITRLHDRRDAAMDLGEDAGFTLIELMVVLLILAILLAIAIPTFLGVTKSANDRAAQSNLNTALTNAKSIFQTNSQSYPTTASILAGSLTTAEPSLSFVSGGVNTTSNATQSTVGVAVASDGQGVMMAEMAKGTGTCWFVADLASAENGATSTASASSAAGTWYGKQTGQTTCTPGFTGGLSGATWQQNGFPG
jgi:type IV pilus assembly protein PilA